MALSEASRLENLLSEILLYAKPQVLQLCELDVNEFINIVRNACEAVSAGDAIKWEVDISSPDKICIHVCNGGEPIPSEVLSFPFWCLALFCLLFEFVLGFFEYVCRWWFCRFFR